MDKKAEVYRFPQSKRERKKILTAKIDPRLRFAYRMRRFTGFAFVLLFIALLAANFSLLSPQSVSRFRDYAKLLFLQQTEKTNIIDFSGSSADDTQLFNGGLVVVEQDMLYVAMPGGITQLQTQLSYSDPVIDTCDKYILAYDRGGTSLTLANTLTTIQDFQFESPILSASIGDAGNFAVITDESGYKSAVTVFNASQKQVFKWSSSEYYIMSAALSPNGRYMSVLCIAQDGVDLVSHIISFDLTQDTPLAETPLTNQLAIDLEFLSDRLVCVICDKATYLTDLSGDVLDTLPYSSASLLGYDVSHGRLALALSSYSRESRSNIYLFDGDNRRLDSSIALQGELAGLSVNEQYIAVLTSDGVTLYDDALIPRYQYSGVSNAKNMLLREDDSLCLVYAKEARIVYKSDLTPLPQT